MPDITVPARPDAPNLCPGSGVQYPKSAGKIRQCPFCGTEVEFVGGQVLRHERNEEPLFELVGRLGRQVGELEGALVMLRAQVVRLEGGKVEAVAS